MFTNIRFTVSSVPLRVVQILTQISQKASDIIYWGMSIVTSHVMTIHRPPIAAVQYRLRHYVLTPLTVAAFDGHTEAVRELLRNGRVDPNAIDGIGNTAITLASMHNHPEVVRELLRDERTDPNSIGEGGDTAILAAAREGYADVVRELLRDERTDPNAIDRYYNDTALTIAAERNYTEVVRELLGDERTDPNAIDRDGNTTLIAATKRGYTEAVRELLRNGRVDPNAIDGIGNTAITLASMNNHPEVVRELLRDGRLDPNNAGKSGCIALIWAARQKSKDIQLALLRDRRVNRLTAEDLSRLSEDQREYYKNVRKEHNTRSLIFLLRIFGVLKHMTLSAAERVYALGGEGFSEAADSFYKTQEELLQRQAVMRVRPLGAKSAGYQEENQPEGLAADQPKQCDSCPDIKRTMS